MKALATVKPHTTETADKLVALMRNADLESGVRSAAASALENWDRATEKSVRITGEGKSNSVASQARGIRLRDFAVDDRRQSVAVAQGQPRAAPFTASLG